jgi:hypothetical protein
MTNSALQEATPRQLLTLFANILNELRRRDMVRTSNNPVADYTEFLVAHALALSLMRNSTSGCDAVDSSGNRYEIKGRRLTRHNTSPQLGAIRKLESCQFDYLAGVLFDEDFSVRRACLVPHEVVRNIATYRQHVNGWILLARPSLWEQEGVRDITSQVRAAQEGQASRL